MEPGFFMPWAELATAPSYVQEWHLERIKIHLGVVSGAMTDAASEEKSEPIHPLLAILKEDQAREAYERFSAKPRTVIKLFAQAEASGITLLTIASVLEIQPQSLRGVWSGMTKVTRRITREPTAELIAWTPLEQEGNYTGLLHPITWQSFRRLLEIR